MILHLTLTKDEAYGIRDVIVYRDFVLREEEVSALSETHVVLMYFRKLCKRFRAKLETALDCKPVILPLPGEHLWFQFRGSA